MDSYFKSVVYGGTDGIITIFNIISGITGAKLNMRVAIILSLSVLISDAVSMAFSDYSSTRVDRKLGYTQNDEVKSGVITFVSFILFGLIPLSLFLLMSYYNPKNAFIFSLIAVMVSLFILGAIKSKYNKENMTYSGLWTASYGFIASMISFLIGNYMSKIF